MKSIAIITATFAITGAAAAMPPPAADAEAEALRAEILQLLEANADGDVQAGVLTSDQDFTPPEYGSPEYHAMMAMRCAGPPAPFLEELDQTADSEPLVPAPRG